MPAEMHLPDFSTYEELLSDSGTELPADGSWQRALAVCTNALALFNRGELEAAVAACNDLLRICAEGSIPNSLGLESVAKHLKWQAGLRGVSGDDTGATFQTVLASFGLEPSEILAGLVTKGLVDKGVALLGSASDEEAQQALDSASERLVGASSSQLRYWAVRTLLDKGLRFREEDRTQEAITVVDRVLEWLAEDDHTAQDALPVRTMLLKASLLDDNGATAEAFRAYEQVDRIAALEEVPGEDALTMYAREALNDILLRVTRQIHPDTGTIDSVDSQPWSQRDLPLRLEAINLYTQAQEAMISRQPAKAVRLSTKMLKLAPSSLARVRLEAHWIGAMGCLRLGKYDQRAVEHHITEALRLLARFDSTTLEAVRFLSAFSGLLGAGRVLQLIEDSPSSKLLVLLRLSLERELGRTPSVPAAAKELLDSVAEHVVRVREEFSSTQQVAGPAGEVKNAQPKAAGASEPSDSGPGESNQSGLAAPRKPSKRRKRSAKARHRPRRR